MLFFSACLKKLPNDLKPIDWVNYNDVYTVYWNNTNNCAKSDYRNENKKIKVYGWIKQDPYGNNYFSHGFTLIDDQSQILAPNIAHCSHVGISFGEEVKVDTNEIILKKKCYIEGELIFDCLPLNRGNPLTSTIIRVYNSNDIYF
jgi:hypothetical protein